MPVGTGAAGRSFKYAAALQHANPNGDPRLIRIETRAGHGSGKPTDKQIEGYTEMYPSSRTLGG